MTTDDGPDTIANAVKSFGVRLPDDLYSWLARVSERERRSMNSQLIVLLEKVRATEAADDAAHDAEPGK